MILRCKELAKLAATKGDAEVGSVIVNSGKIIAEGIESVKAEKDPTAHAEIIAVRLACQTLNTLDLSDCILYTNVEPCWMCSYAIRQTKISQIVFATQNEKVGGISSEFRVLVSENLKMPIPEIENYISGKNSGEQRN